MIYEFDVHAFWEENELCLEPFTTKKPRVPIHFGLDDHFLLELLNPPSTVRYYQDHAYRMHLNKIANDKLEPVLGRRFYPEEEMRLAPNRFEVLMGAEWKLTEGGTPWLESSVQDIGDAKRLIQRAAKLDMKKLAFPNGWQEEKKRYEAETGKKIKLGGGSRGPATMATSILGTTNTCMFMIDEPELMDDFFAVLAEKLVEYQKVLLEATDNQANAYYILDDNCFLFPPKLYERYCAPVLERLFAEFAPLPEHTRFQHSDSDMGHLMEILWDLGVNGVNLGPNIEPIEIRRKMPGAVIHGQIPPFVLRNGSFDEIISYVQRDIEQLGGDGGLVECPAGSVPGGTPLENLKVYMWAVHTYGRY